MESRGHDKKKKTRQSVASSSQTVTFGLQLIWTDGEMAERALNDSTENRFRK